jgi:predicted phage terminase large subunit-like protein
MAVVALQTDPKRIAHAERSELIQVLNYQRRLGNEQIKRMVLEQRRIDILATQVLGYEVKPFHLAMMQFQFLHPHNLQLVFRGAGKSTVCTVVKAIHLLLCDPNLRILIASKTVSNAEAFLKEIKSHLEGNVRLAEIFGPTYDPHVVPKWDSREIEILGRTKPHKEASITCAGVDGTIVSRHYDIILSDDLVDEENSRTSHMRDKTKTWHYKTLDPCLEPPCADVPHRGEHHMEGTRYHPDELYGHLIAHELKEHHQIIKPYDGQGKLVWPERYPLGWFREKEEKAGTIIFAGQYLNEVEGMRGEVFDIDDCQRVKPSEIPSGMAYFMGVDLAISLKKKNDRFAIVIVGMNGKDFYVVDHFSERIRVAEQTKTIRRLWRKWHAVAIGIEVNSYQEAQKQLLEDKDPEGEMCLVPIQTQTDKLTKAWKLSPLFQGQHMFFAEGAGPVISEIVGMPNGEHDDLFDALDNAVRAARTGRRRKRERQAFGVL